MAIGVTDLREHDRFLLLLICGNLRLFCRGTEGKNLRFNLDGASV